jgi:hypothetical protein
MSNETEGFHYSFILEKFEDSWSHLGDVKKSASFCAFRNLEPLLKSQGRLFNNQLKSGGIAPEPRFFVKQAIGHR